MKKKIKIIFSLFIISLFLVRFACDKTNPVNNNDFIIDTVATVTDADGNLYHGIKIGNQVWTVENLRVTHYNDGTPITKITDITEWVACTTGTAAYCYYDNDSVYNAEKYGALYNWWAVNNWKLPPPGWHVPTNDEWKELEYYLIANGYNWDGTTTGNKIAKAMSSKTYWDTSTSKGDVGNNPSTNNNSGFSALPGGYRENFFGRFNNLGGICYWWSATEDSDLSFAKCRFISFKLDDFCPYRGIKESGFSVKLIKGTIVNIPPTITSNPQSQNVYECQVATFSVKAEGQEPFLYEWYKNDTIVSSGTIDKIYKTQATTMSDSGSIYKCIVSNVAGSDTSEEAMLTVSSDSLTDVDGNVYHLIQLGNQIWTVENFRCTHYNDGSEIKHITDGDEWSACTTGVSAYCYYKNDSAAYAERYGALYNWHAINNAKLAPKGWHVPTDAEWSELEQYLISNFYNWDGTTTGNKIAKSMAANTGWFSSDTEGTVGNDLSSNNSSGFSALPGGYRTGNFFFNDGYDGFWWSNTDSDASHAYYRNINYEREYLIRLSHPNESGFSVRLVRD